MKRQGWFNDSWRHSLSAKGVKTKRYMAVRPTGGDFLRDITGSRFGIHHLKSGGIERETLGLTTAEKVSQVSNEDFFLPPEQFEAREQEALSSDAQAVMDEFRAGQEQANFEEGLSAQVQRDIVTLGAPRPVPVFMKTKQFATMSDLLFAQQELEKAKNPEEIVSAARDVAKKAQQVKNTVRGLEGKSSREKKLVAEESGIDIGDEDLLTDLENIRSEAAAMRDAAKVESQ
ncbi:hypothetical protein GOV11_00955 [Candidatus Woesearchaeota archaeon]|nr:hypothetical protein [Candidatus Woesearchaeota archaeon]